MNQVEFLLRLSENAQDKGDDIAKRHNAERAAHVKELLELERMIELAAQNVGAELLRFGMVKAGLQQGQMQQRIANGGEHGEQARRAENQKGDGRVQARHAAQ